MSEEYYHTEKLAPGLCLKVKAEWCGQPEDLPGVSKYGERTWFDGFRRNVKPDQTRDWYTICGRSQLYWSPNLEDYQYLRDEGKAKGLDPSLICDLVNQAVKSHRDYVQAAHEDKVYEICVSVSVEWHHAEVAVDYLSFDYDERDKMSLEDRTKEIMTYHDMRSDVCSEAMARLQDRLQLFGSAITSLQGQSK